jgi:hypothetical protein
MVRDASGETRPPSESRARATYQSSVSKLNAFTSLSLFIPLLSSFSTTASASIFAPPQRFFKRPPPEKSSLNRARRCQRRSTRLVPFPSCCLSCACACARARFPRCVPDATGTPRPRVACAASALAPRACPRPPASHARAAGPWNLPARAPSSRATRAAPCAGRPPRCVARSRPAQALPPPPQVPAAAQRAHEPEGGGPEGEAERRGCSSHSHLPCHRLTALPVEQQSAGSATRLVVRLLRWGELVRR